MRQWEKLPKNMQTSEVRPYYDYLQTKKCSLLCKYIFDRIVAFGMLVCLLPIFMFLAFMIKKDSPGPVFFRQERVTQYGKLFKIYKFRTMVQNAESLGTQVTTKSDMRVTEVGKKLRGCRLDELPQLINILKGEMSFVGTRPEVLKYVKCYTPEMLATLLLPAGVTSEASVQYKDEERLLANSKNADDIYINDVLPQKMQWNFRSLRQFSIIKDIKIMLQTLGVMV